MEITGKIIAAMPPQSGVSQRSGQPWMSQNFVLETDERFPQRLVFKVFGQDKIQQFAIQMGEVLTVQFGVDAHESNGRWFGENTAYNVVRGQIQQAMPQGGYAPQPQYQQQPVQQMQQMQQQVQSPLPPQQPVQQAPVQNPFPPQQPAPGQAIPPQPAPQQQAPQQPQQGGLPF